MTPVDPELVDLLERSAAHNLTAVEAFREDLGGVRRALDDARRAQDEDRRLEADRFGRLHRRLDDLELEVSRVDAKCGALVLEEDDEAGEVVIRARPARVGLDRRTIAGLVVTLIVALLSSPLLIELLK